MKLPQDIAADYARLTGNATAKASIRALADIDGNLGEAYVVTNGASLHIFSRRLGEKVTTRSIALSDIASMEVEDDRPFAYLNLAAGDQNLRLKFGALDRDELSQLVRLWEAGAGNPPPAAEPPPLPADAAAKPLTPFLGFAAALQAMVEVDGSVDGEETHVLRRVVGSNEVVAQALDYLRRHGAEALQRELGELLDKRQKLCLLANLIEVAMVDGYLRGDEQQLLLAFLQALGIDQEAYETIYEVLAIKNNLSIFTVD